MLLKIEHRSEYSYDSPVQYGLQRLHQTPPSRNGQTVTSWRTTLKGAREEVSYNDHFNNPTSLISLEPDTQLIEIISSGTVETLDIAGVVGKHTDFTPLWLFMRETALTRSTPAIRALARDVTGDDDTARMHRLLALIAERVKYTVGSTDVTTSADEALKAGTGVCQDHTHIFLAVARVLGVPARYVSGFLMMEGQTQQAASHAWAEVYLDNLGWVGFDASNGISPDERYVCVATGLDYRDAAPISGIRHGFAMESLAVSVMVEQ